MCVCVCVCVIVCILSVCILKPLITSISIAKARSILTIRSMVRGRPLSQLQFLENNIFCNSSFLVAY